MLLKREQKETKNLKYKLFQKIKSLLKNTVGGERKWNVIVAKKCHFQ